jgi:neutral ceramidase
MRRAVRRVVLGLVGLPLLAYFVLLVDWRGPDAPTPPVMRRGFDVPGPLRAGASRVRLAPPMPVVRAGYGLPRAVAESERDPLEVRALVLRAGGHGIALVLVDLVLVPAELASALEARVADLRLDGVLLVATHTHSSVGGFDRRTLAQVIGTGRYRPEVMAGLLDRCAEALRQAARQSEAVHVWTAETRLPGWAQNRSTPGGAIDDALSVAELRTEGGVRLATVAVVAAHPTLFPRTTPQLSADYPGEAMRRMGAGRGPAFLLQGAAGDARPPGSGAQGIEEAGAFVSRRVEETLAGARRAQDGLGFAEVEIRLPRAEPQAIRSFLARRPASNVLEWMAPETSRVTVLRLGDVVLLGLPGEPTALAAERMVAALPKTAVSGRRVRVISLVGDYVGYIDTPERAMAGEGEARRAWFGPELLDVMTRGMVAALSGAGRRARGHCRGGASRRAVRVEPMTARRCE